MELAERTRLRHPAAHRRGLHPRPLVLGGRDDLPDPAGHGRSLGPGRWSSGSPGRPPSRSPRPACTGPSRRCCASPATCGGAGSSETFGEDPFLIGELRVGHGRAATRATGWPTRPRSWPAPSTSPATRRRRAAATRARPTSPGASCARGSCRRSSGWRARAAARSCSATSPSTACRSPSTSWLLNDVLRGEWGYTGTLITDWDNVGRMVWEQQVQPDYAHAAAARGRAPATTW